MKIHPLLSLTSLVLVFLVACQPRTAEEEPTEAEPAEAEPAETKPAELKPGELKPAETKPAEAATGDELSRAYFASGCFWCVEAVFESVKGVEEAISGYSGGHTENPTYESSNTGLTGHAEAVEVIYDPGVVSFSQLVDVYFGSHNVTQVNGQGPDRGSQYRSIIFYQSPEEKAIIDTKVEALNQELGGEKVAAEITPFEKFWIAERYHQDYEKNHPDDPYVRGVSVPRLKRFQAKFPHLLKEGVAH